MTDQNGCVTFSHCSKYEDVAKPLQDALVCIDPLGAHECVVPHLAHPQDQVAVQAIAFLAALVCRGNVKVQKNIGQCLKNSDIELLMRMDAILKSSSMIIKSACLR